MKHVRTALALGTVAALAVSGAASGAPKAKPKPKPPPCAIVDVSGDAAPKLKDVIFPLDLSPAPAGPIPAPAGFPDVALGPSVDALDITSAGMLVDKKWVTVLIRLKRLSATAPTSHPTGMRWKFFWTADDIVLSMGAHADPTGAITYDAAHVDPTLGSQLYDGGVTGMFDTVRSEIRMTAPTSLFAGDATIKLGTKLSHVHVVTGMELAVPEKSGKLGGGAMYRAYPVLNDEAVSNKTYVVGSPSCVLTPAK